MKKTKFISSVLALAIAAAFPVVAQEKGARSLFVAETNSVKATVEDIDYDKREVTLKGPEGNEVKLQAGDEVKNFDQIRKGDEVIAGYYESVAITVGKLGETTPSAAQTDTVLVAPKGQKPGRVQVETTEVTATIEHIDRSKREVTLKGPQGKKVKVKVDPSVGTLENIKKGDEITATYTEALAISVEKPKK